MPMHFDAFATLPKTIYKNPELLLSLNNSGLKLNLQYRQ